jgi:MFS family permease
MGLISHGAKNRGMALGVFSVAGTIGLITGPFLAGLLNWLAGWQTAYLALGFFGFLWGVALLLVKIDETPLETHEDDNGRGEEPAAHPLRRLVLFFWIVTLGGLVYRINIVALPAHMEFKAPFLSRFFHSLHIPDIAATTTMAAALLTSLVYIAGIFGQLFGGRLADRHDLRRLYLIFNGVSLPLVILIAFMGEQYLVAAAAAYVFFALGIQPIENSLIAHFTPRQWRSTGYGFAAILIFGVGALAVYLVGWVSEYGSLGTVYLLAGGLIFLIIVHILLLMYDTRNVVLRNRAGR